MSVLQYLNALEKVKKIEFGRGISFTDELKSKLKTVEKTKQKCESDATANACPLQCNVQHTTCAGRKNAWLGNGAM